MNHRMTLKYILAISGTSLLIQATSAQAASESCSLSFGAAQCWTEAVAANSRSHHVHIDISSHITWSVVDIDNDAVVARGTSGWLGTERTITGLYGKYVLHLQNAATAVILGGSGTIHNN
ncbi:MAG: hypothetical protein M3Q07_26510 [Pseudobdellovibrionaceae bacterium]|nr:hypothetical protein [Pseudobdellovibrionaceae bacterium]